MLEKLKRKQEDIFIVAPFANMYEKDRNIILALEMPGVDKSTLDVRLNGTQLIIQARKRKEEAGKEYKPLYQERSPVAYERRFEINTDIDRGSVEAEYKDGILKVLLVKAEVAQPRKIAIKS
ncbi:MAG TPA: Hsp20/alpha crystallin family protein [Candidatus Omnitrophota bacterium]|nr:Hsp20/alpha crystallin family protein [Candidatus Omnitrophota bacterium]HPB67599.1 Hsp20/alpha crystallin family protein [Candidatus Omnitrophota bacterium]HQO57876.1 Hsp20/alpha crystallin family protein [Candidatus Omnitrophota bacterium]HQP11480.1 Hsp20/alpha crystallin family protein [Candidatus Omnitrophota bacterium]